MSGTKITSIIKDKFVKFEESSNKKKSLLVVFGLLGDLDSLEYGRFLAKKLLELEKSEINLYAIGIGDSESKKNFCAYTGLPPKCLKVVNTSSIHQTLTLSSGRDLGLGGLFNLLVMCFGINSPGTISEVLRGYTGDKQAPKIFEDDEIISFCKVINFKASFFNLAGGTNFMRPFELASLRLMNMIEVLSKWNQYMIDHKFLTQRVGTFLIDCDNNLIYSYRSKSLLGYSENIRNPLDFINKIA